MRGWMVASLAGVAALLLALSLRGSDDDRAGADVAPAPPAAGSTGFSPAPPPPRLPGAGPAPAATDLDALIERHAAESDAQLDEQLDAIDGEIATRGLIELANAGPLSADDEAALRGLLQRRNAVNVVKARRLIARLEARGPVSRPEATP